MVASHANKKGRRYRYYVSQNLQQGGDAANSNGMRLPAPEIESLVCTRLADLFDDPMSLIEDLAVPDITPDAMAKAVTGAKAVADILRGSAPASYIQLLEQIIARIDIAAESVTITLNSRHVVEQLGLGSGMASPSLEIIVPVRLKRSGLAMRLILPGGEHAAARTDENLIRAIAKAQSWWRELQDNPQLNIADLAASHGIGESWTTRMLRLAFLDPAIIELVLDGKAPADFTLEALKVPDAVPTLWSAQRLQHRIAITR